MTLEDAIAIKLAFSGPSYFQPPIITDKEGALLMEAERLICARARALTGCDFPEKQVFYSLVKTPEGFEYRRDPPGTLDHLGYPESKGKLP